MSPRPSSRRALLRSLPIFGLTMWAVVPVATPAFAQSLPSGGQIVAGQATIAGAGTSALTVTQSSAKAIIDWKGFSIGETASVRFQNGRDGATLNRVTGSSASVIDGLLSGEGSVYLINKNGIVVGKTGQIDVGGRFVGSTQNMSNENFLAGGNLTLSGASEAAIVNYGKIGSVGGDVALVAAKVRNEGRIEAANGTVGLLAGYQVMLRDQALEDGKFSVVIGGSATSATNLGAIRAAEAELRAQGGNVYALAGNTSGIINAQGVSGRDGRIFLTAKSGGEVQIAGTLTARKADGSGGLIEATGTHVLLDAGAKLDASGTTGGAVLVGGDWQGGADAALTVADHDVAHADAVVMRDGASINVSGTGGAGGRAVLWSDAYTDFSGAITARGTTDGGRVETSSKGVLQAVGTVDALAVNGMAGKWLLDPSDITISTLATSNGAYSGASPNVFSPSAATSVANVATINASLNAGTSVTIATASGAAGNGDITLATGSAISKTSGGDASLTLQAERNITINSAITASGTGKLDVLLNSRSANGTTGYVTIPANITTNGGNLSVWGGNGGINTGAATGTTTAQAGVAIGGTLDAGGGNITMRGSSTGSGNAPGLQVDSSGTVKTSGTGTITLSADSTQNYALTIAGTVASAAGAVNLTGSSAGAAGAGVGLAVIGGTITSTTGNITAAGTSTGTDAGLYVTSGGRAATIQSTSGNIAISGTASGSTKVEGVVMVGSNAVTVATGGAGSVSIVGRGGTDVFGATRTKSAVGFGLSSQSTPLTIAAGTGGLTIAGNSPSGAAYSVFGYLTSASSITSAGALTIGGDTSVAGVSSLGVNLSNAAINATGAIRIGAATSGGVALGNVTGAGTIYIGAQTGDVTLGTLTKTGSTGTVQVGGGAALTIGAISLATNEATTLGGSGTVSLGAMTTTGNGDISITSGTDLTTAAITKKAAATGTSNLIVRSNANLTVGNNITTESGAGAFNVTLNSRAADTLNGTAVGYINVAGNISTQGGNIVGYGSTDPNGYAVSTSSSANSVYLNNAALNAGGGNISFRGKNNSNSSNSAVSVYEGTSLITTGAGGITLVGDATAGGSNGVNFWTSSLSAGTGGITLTGTSNATSTSASGVNFGSVTNSIRTTGDLTITGTSVKGVGVSRQATGLGTFEGRNILITGTSSDPANSQQGILIHNSDPSAGNSKTAITGSNSVTLIGTGGATGGNSSAGAIVFGDSNRNATVLIDAGAGGLTMTGTNNGPNAIAFSIDNWASATQAHNYTSAGAVNITGNKYIYLRGNVTQTGSGDGVIAAGGALTTAAISNNGGNLTITAGDLITATGLSGSAAAITAAGALNISAATSMTVGNLSAGTSLLATAGGSLNAGTITQTGSAGPVTLTAGTALTNGTVTLATNDTTTLTAGTSLSTGAITTAGSGNITLSAVSDITTPSITKKAAATGASSLGIASRGDLTVNNAILTESGAGAFNVTLNSRSADSLTGTTSGSIFLNGDITTRGGNILAYGSTDTAGFAYSNSTSRNGLQVDGVNLDAGGGSITLRGATNTSGSLSGMVVTDGSVLTTSGTGGISLSGDGSAGGGNGLNIYNASMVSGSGGISLTGKATAGNAVALISATQAINANAGDLTITGTSSTGIGIIRVASGTGTFQGRNVVFNGLSSSVTASNQGILLKGASTTNITGTNSVTLTGTGGAVAAENSSAAAIAFGDGDVNTSIAINAGAGGLTITGTNLRAGTTSASGGLLFGLDNFLGSGQSYTYNSAGTINITSNKYAYIRGTITQTGGGDSTISAVNQLAVGPITQNAGGLTLISTAGSVTTDGLAAGSYTGLSAAGKLNVSAATNVLANGITQTGASGNVTITAGGSITTGATSLRTNDATIITAGTTLTSGAITTTGSGNIALTAGSSLTTPSITKRAAATAASTLTVKSNADVTVGNAILAEAGAGAFNVTLNSRAADSSNAVAATVGVTSAITTQGGNILVRGGSGALLAVTDPSTSYSGFVSALNATGTAITLGSNVLTAGGGNIELRGLAASGDGFSMASGTLATTGSGNLSIYGLGSPAAATNGNGVTISGGTVSAANGNVTVFGASRHTAGTVGVLVSGGEVKTNAGSLNVVGAAPATINAGTGAIGVQLNGKLTVAGGAGTLNVTGQGGGAASSSYGVNLYGGSVNSASSGAVTITGQGGSSAGVLNYGINLDAQGSTTPLVNATGSGAVTLTGMVAGGTTFGIYNASGAGAGAGIGTTSLTGTLTLAANRMYLNNSSGGSAVALLTQGALVIKPLSGGSLTVDSNILAALYAGGGVIRPSYASVTFGASDAAALTYVSPLAAYSTYSMPLTLSSGGTIAIADAGMGIGLLANGGLAFAGTGTVTQAVNVTTSLLSGRASAVALTRAGNSIAALGALDVTGNLSLVDNRALTIQGATTVGTGLIRATGDLTFAAGGSVTASGTGTPLQLTTTTRVVNNAGAAALSATNGRWLLWSQDPGNDTLGALAYGFKQFGAAYGASSPAQASGNGVMYTLSPTLSVSLTGAYSRVYDGTNAATLAQSNYAVTGLMGTDAATIYSTATFDTKDVGTAKTVLADDMAFSVRNGAIRVYGYTLSTISASGAIGAITPKLLTATLGGSLSKVYDGLTTATLGTGNYGLSGVIGSEVVTLNNPTTGSYADKNAGAGKTVTVSGLALGGADAANYIVNTSASANIGTITAKALTVALAGTAAKTYDGNTVATLGASNYLLGGVVSGDAAQLNMVTGGTYADRNAGTGKTVTVTGLSLTGTDAANYSVASSVSGAIGTINARNLTLTAVGGTKIYDGTLSSSGAVVSSGLVSGDGVVATQVYDSRNAGSRTLQVADGYTVADGNSGANYTVTLGAAATGTITAKTLNLSASTDTKGYDGTTTSAGVVQSLGLVAGDTVTATQAFDTKNAGARSLQVAGYAIGDGNGGGNYTVVTGSAAGFITQKTITAALTVADKTYDATTSATGTVSGLTGVVAGDTVAAGGGTLTFADRNAGNGKAVTANGYTLTGADAGNYALAAIGALSANITRAALTLKAGASTKTYDGTTASTGTVIATGLLGGDSFGGATQVFDSKNAGSRTAQVVNNSWTIADGNGGANYAVTLDNATAGTIAAKALTLTAVTDSKVYDGTIASTGIVSAAGLVSGDTVAATQAYNTRNAGGRTLQVSGYTISDGNAGGNYTVALGSAAAGTITQKTISAAVTVNNKTYDATTAATGTVSGLTGVVAGDTVGAGGGTLAFSDRNAGNGKAVTASGYTLTGADAGNYALAAIGGLSANINKATLTLKAGSSSKVYDGTTASAGTVAATGLLGTDSFGGATQVYDSRNAGGRTLQVVNGTWTINDGNGGANYAVTLGTTTAGAITAKTLTLGASNATKVYDGTTASTGAVSVTGLVAGDTVSATQAYNSKDAGSRVLQVAGYTIGDGNGGSNYAVTVGAAAAGTITQKAITAAVTVANKTYDATTAATGTVSGLTGVVGVDAVTAAGGTLAFVDRNAGNGKAVTASGYTLTGADAGNYTLGAVAATSANITKAALTLKAGSSTKTYDGTTASAGTVVATGLLGSDSFGGATQVFDSKNAGGRTAQVVANSWTINDGNGGSNYAVTLGTATAGTIAAKALTLTASTGSKVYDGTTASTGTVSATGLVTGDTVSATQVYSSRNAGSRTLQVASGYTISDGNSGGNYAVTLNSAVAGTITQKAITANVMVANKTYDATTAATGTVSGLSGVVSGDTVTAGGGTLAFLDRNAGNGKAVTVTGYTLGGVDAGNYTLSAIANGTANIARANLILRAANATKIYDGTVTSDGMVTASGLRGSDALSAAVQTYDGRDAGSHTLQVVNGSWTIADGNGGNNYAVTLGAAATGTINAKSLILSAVTADKVYDGTTSSMGVVQTTGLVLGDTVTATQAYNSRNAGNRTLQVATDYVIADGNGGGNYVVSLGAAIAGTISTKTILADVSVADKTYDATTDATGTFHGLLGVVGGDTVGVDRSSGTLAFLDRNAGNGKAVTARGYTLTGADAANYTLSNIANGVANIARAGLTLSAVASNKIYDATSVSNGVVTATGLVGSDTIDGLRQAFDSKNAGSRLVQVVNGSWTIADGNNGNNYTVTIGNAAAGTINRRELSAALTGTITKTYDGTIDATVLPTNLAGVLAGDAVTVSSSSAVYGDKNAGTNKLVSVTGLSLNGADRDNYILQAGSTSGYVGTITARSVTVSATGRGAKTYDATNVLDHSQLGTIGLVMAAGDGATQSLLNADGVSLDTTMLSGTLADRNAGTGKVASLEGYALNGDVHHNYVLASSTAQSVADVARAALVLTAGSDTKTYDGTVVSAGSVQAAGLVAGDTVAATQAFDAKGAGNRSLQVQNGFTVSDGNGGGNYAVSFGAAAAGTIARRLVTTTVTANTKIYDGTTAATGSFAALDNLVAGDVASVDANGTLTFADRNAGAAKTVTAAGFGLTGADAANYRLDTVANGSAAILARSLILTASAESKVYDGTATSAGVVQASNLVAGDSVSATQAFESKNAGNRTLQVRAGYVVNDGFGGGNYVVSLGAATAGTISKRTLTTSVAVADKVYDGTTNATGTFGALSNIVAGDTVALDGHGIVSFTDRNVGSAKSVTIAGLGLTGMDAANYQLSSLASSNASIQRRAVTLTAATDSKVYDGTTASSGAVRADNLVAGDLLIAAQAFDGKNAGSRTLQVANGWIIADGNNSGNYLVSIADAVAGTITPKSILANVTVANKVYDGTTLATGSFDGLNGVVSGDRVAVDGSTGTLSFLDRNAGNGKAVTASGATLSGADAGNYRLASVANGTANIAKATLTLTATADSRTYDATRTSAGVVGIAGLVSTDTATAVQTFDTKNAGARTLQVSGWTIDDGNAGGNYAVVRVDATGSIAQKGINASLIGTVAKVYDGTTAATILPTNLDGIVAGDAVTVSTSSASYDDRNAGTNKLVTVSGIALSGVDAANYLLGGTSASANVGTIAARAVTVTASGTGAKVYDRTALLGHDQLGTTVLTAADGDAFTQHLLAADGVMLDVAGVTGMLADRNAGTGKAMTLGGYTLTGNGLGNYALASTTTQGLADIARAALTLTASTDARIYDGTTASSGAVTATGLIAGDTLTATQGFDSRNAGNRLLQVRNGYVVSDGNDGGNYAVTLVDTAGTIARRLVTTTVSIDDKVYDGTTVASGSYGALGNVVAGDSVIASGGTLAFADRNAGLAKAVGVTGTTLVGGDAGNYLLSTVGGGTATISAKALTLAASTDHKVYDGTTVSAGMVGATGLVTGDGFTASQRFDGKDAGTRLLRVADGWAVADGNGGANYRVTLVDAAGGTIDRRTVSATAFADDKQYDGTTAATGTFGALTNVIGNDVVVLDGTYGRLAFADRNAGTAKAVTVAGVSLGGADAGNYQLAGVANGTATITRKAATLHAVTDTKTYDGTTASGGMVQATGLIAGDTLVATQAFDGHTAGAHLIQVANGWAIGDGNNGGNYTVSLGNAATGTIARRIVAATVDADTKVYDGTAVATGSFSGLANVVAGDSVTLESGNGTFSFADRNVGAGKAVTVSGVSLDGADAGNYLLSAIGTSTGAITKKTLTLTAANDVKIYDGTTVSTGPVASSGLVVGDGITAVQAFDSKNAGSRTLQVSGWTIDDGNAGGNYQVVLDTAATGSISQKILNAALTGVVSKVYDRTNAAILLPTNIDGVIAGDALTVLSSSASYDDANVGTGKLVTVSGLALSGSDAGNYILNGDRASANIGTITPRTVAVTTTGRGGKTYDGTAALASDQLGTLNLLIADGDATTQAMLAADGVTLDSAAVTGRLADRNAGTGKGVILTGYDLTSNSLGNYALGSRTVQALADVARAQLTLMASSDSKTYDGTTASTGLVQINGLVGGDSAIASQVFDAKNAGNRQLNVASSYVVDDGNGGANYRVTAVNAAGTIAQRAVSTTATVDNKVYDGTNAATGALAALQNVVAGDNVGVTGLMFFADKNAGMDKVVTVANAGLTGLDAGNYALAAIANSRADITKASLVLTASADSRQYDGTTASSGVVAANGLAIGDSVSGLVQSFDDKNAGGRTLGVGTGYTINDGNGGNNYVVSSATASGAIVQRVLTSGVTVNTKEYDGTTVATGAFNSLGNIVAGDVVTLSGGTLAFADRNAGNLKAVYVSGAVLTGSDAANYVLSNVATGTGTITRKGLTLNAVADTRAYDGTTASSSVVRADGLVTGDAVNATQRFDGKDAGDHIVQVNGWAVSDGNNGGNYVVSVGDAASGTITRRILNAIGQVQGKVYDGTTAASGTVRGLSGVIGTEDVSLGGTGQFAFLDRNAGNGKAVTVSGLTLAGADARNYRLADVANGTADIAKAVLTLTASGDGKVYDGSVASTGAVTIDGLVAGDTATAGQAFDAKGAGSRNLIVNRWSVADGNDGGNYQIVRVAAGGSIARKQLSGALTGTVSKTYDGTADATLLATNLDGVIRGDDLTVSTSGATYADRNVGTGKLVTVSGITLRGEDGGNYLLLEDQASANVGTITPRVVTVSASGSGSKTYDGTALLAANQLGSLELNAADGDAATQALLLADGVTLDGSAMTGMLADRNAGTGKSVTLGGYGLLGDTFGNYVLATPTTFGLANIARAALTFTAGMDARVYDGTTASAAQVTVTGLVAGDTASATQRFDSRNAGGRTLIVNGDYALDDGNGGGNYVVTLAAADGTIERRQLGIVLNDASKAAGAVDPAMSFTVEGDLVAGDNVQGTPVRDAGESAGSYAIRQGSVAVSDNYAVRYTMGHFTINANSTGGTGGTDTGGTTGGTGGTDTGGTTGGTGGTDTGGTTGGTGGTDTGGTTGGTGGTGTGGTPGGTGGTGTGGTPGGNGTGVITPQVQEQARELSDTVTRTIQTGAANVSTLPAGSFVGFDGSAGFAFGGSSQLPGSVPISLRVMFGTDLFTVPPIAGTMRTDAASATTRQAAGNATASKDAAATGMRSDEGKDAGRDGTAREKSETERRVDQCGPSDEKNGNCSAVKGSGLPYPTNRMVSPSIRFTID